MFKFGAGDWFGTTSPVAVDDGVPFVGYLTCPPACSEEGASDRYDGVVSDSDGSHEYVAEMIGWLFHGYGCVDDR